MGPQEPEVHWVRGGKITFRPQHNTQSAGRRKEVIHRTEQNAWARPHDSFKTAFAEVSGDR